MLLSLSVSGISGGVNTDRLILVPNVEGISVVLATQTLLMVDLAPRLASSAQPSALIVRQEPRPGATLPPGGEVVLATSLTDNLSRVVSTTDTRGLLPPTTVHVTGGADRSRSLSSSNTLTSSGSPVNSGQILTLPDGQGTIFYQPSQAPVNPYFTQSTTPRLYPPWYPKHLLTQGTASQQNMMGITVQPGTSSPAVVSEQSQRPYQIAVTPVTSVAPQPLYPRVDPYQPGYSTVSGWGGAASTTQPVGVYATSTNPAVSMPNVLRLYQADATAALSRVGLTASLIYVDSAEGRSGVVVQQAPAAYALIQSGSIVQLWIAR